MRLALVVLMLTSFLHLWASPIEKPLAPRDNSAGEPAEGASVAQAPLYRSQTDLVYLTVTVTDRAGRPVTGLQASDVRVYEDGIEQKIEHFTTSRRPPHSWAGARSQ